MQPETINGFRLSQQQARLWAAQGENDLFCAQCAIQIAGPLDVTALQNALDSIVVRHEILRTNYARLPGMPLPVQVVAEAHTPTLTVMQPSAVIQAVDGRCPIDEAHLEELCLLLFTEARRHEYDLVHESPLRCTLLPLPAAKHLLLLTLPTVAADSWSLDNLVRELADTYAIQHQTHLAAQSAESDLAESDLEDEVLQYTQFSEWQHAMAEDGENDEEAVAGRAYWQEQALNEQPRLQLPQAQHAAARQPDAVRRFDPDTLRDLLPGVTTAQISSLATTLGTTPATLLFTCWQMLLWRVTGERTFVIGETHHGRLHEMLHAGLGLFATTLPVVTRIDPNLRVRDLVARNDRARQDATTWLDYVPEDLPTPQVGFAFSTAPTHVAGGALAMTVCAQRVVTERYPLKLVCHPGTEQLTVALEYDRARFAQAEVARLLHHFSTLVQNAVQTPELPIGRLALLDEADCRQLLVAFNDTALDLPSERLWHDSFAEQARRTPDRVAIICEQEQLTYGELNRRANQLAHHLQTLGVGPDVPVGLCMERSPEMIVGVLAILKAGGAYLPLDPMYPVARLAFTLADARAPVLLTQSALMQEEMALLDELHVIAVDASAGLWAQQPITNPSGRVLAENLAYAIYTSGSTGRPKGVMVRHSALCNLVAALHRDLYTELAPTEDEPLRISLNAPLTFDSSVKQLVQLVNGHTLHIVPEAARPDGEALLAFCRAAELDVLDCTPVQLQLLVAAGLGTDPERDPDAVLIGGEAIEPALWTQLAQSQSSRFYNLYGPTECTVDATAAAVHLLPDQPLIGRPMANVQLYILDEQLQPVPIGTPGELYIGGAGLARGYLNAPDLTAARFVPNPYSADAGARIYRTGDLATYMPAGTVRFLGRADHQVKIRGFRIELGEIEAVLAEHPLIREAVVTVQGEADPRLVAYVVVRQDAGGGATAVRSTNGAAPGVEEAVTDELRTFLRTRLPEYMIPPIFVPLAELPLSRNGKVDRQALPAPEKVQPRSSRIFVAPRNEIEQSIAQVWQEVLGLEKVGADDNFFDLGGHSLLMVKVHHELRTIFDRELSLMDMFRNPTVGALAHYLSDGAPTEATLDQAQERGEARKTAREQRRGRRQKRSIVHA